MEKDGEKAKVKKNKKKKRKKNTEKKKWAGQWL